MVLRMVSGVVLRVVTPMLVAMAAIMTTMVMSGAVAMIIFPVAVISIVVPITVPMFAMSVLVIESTYCINHRIGDGCADQHFRNPVTFMISARTERNHQSNCNASGNKPARDRIRDQSPISGVHGVVS
jgi:hypothetical protein